MKSGSHADSAAKDAAVVCSIALQHGVPVDVIQHALLRDARGVASSVLGAALDLICGESEFKLGKHETGFARVERDHYPSPSWVVEALAEHVDLAGLQIWEPATGSGGMAEALKAAGASVYSSDIHRYGYKLDEVLDFTTGKHPRRRFDGLITNPPFGPGQSSPRNSSRSACSIHRRRASWRCCCLRISTQQNAFAPLRRLPALRRQDHPHTAHRLVCEPGQARGSQGKSRLGFVAAGRDPWPAAGHPLRAAHFRVSAMMVGMTADDIAAEKRRRRLAAQCATGASKVAAIRDYLDLLAPHKRIAALLAFIKSEPAAVFWPAFISNWPHCDKDQPIGCC